MKTVLVTVDAVRANRLGQYGYDRDTMPALDRLVTEGVQFDSAYANGPYTRISVPSIHTSRYIGYDRLEDLPTIASVVGDEGAMTACIGTQTGFAGYQGDLVFDEYVDLGRDDYHDKMNQNESPREVVADKLHGVAQKVRPRLERRRFAYSIAKRAYDAVTSLTGTGHTFLGYTKAETVTDEALEWFADNAEEDFFLWLHYMEGHRPYGVHDTNPRYREEPIDEEEAAELMKKAGTTPDEVTIREHRLLSDLYDSDLRYCSRHLERLFDGMADLGLWDATDIVFTSDHGEEFYEHGHYFHRNLPYDELLRVPLFLKSPETSGETVTDQRELLDVAPTVCSLHDVDVPESFLGEHLLEGRDREVIAVGAQIRRDEGVVAGRWDGWKYVHTDDGDQLFDLECDPRERKSVTGDHPDVVDRFKRVIPDGLFEMEGAKLRDPTDRVDREQLDALGYLELKDEPSDSG